MGKRSREVGRSESNGEETLSRCNTYIYQVPKMNVIVMYFKHILINNWKNNNTYWVFLNKKMNPSIFHKQINWIVTSNFPIGTSVNRVENISLAGTLCSAA